MNWLLFECNKLFVLQLLTTTIHYILARHIDNLVTQMHITVTSNPPCGKMLESSTLIDVNVVVGSAYTCSIQLGHDMLPHNRQFNQYRSIALFVSSSIDNITLYFTWYTGQWSDSHGYHIWRRRKMNWTVMLVMIRHAWQDIIWDTETISSTAYSFSCDGSKKECVYCEWTTWMNVKMFQTSADDRYTLHTGILDTCSPLLPITYPISNSLIVCEREREWRREKMPVGDDVELMPVQLKNFIASSLSCSFYLSLSFLSLSTPYNGRSAILQLAL